jgi:hypothetical protein
MKSFGNLVGSIASAAGSILGGAVSGKEIAEASKLKTEERSLSELYKSMPRGKPVHLMSEKEKAYFWSQCENYMHSNNVELKKKELIGQVPLTPSLKEIGFIRDILFEGEPLDKAKVMNSFLPRPPSTISPMRKNPASPPPPSGLGHTQKLTSELGKTLTDRYLSGVRTRADQY